MAIQTKAWEQVGAKFESLGTHLRSRFDEVGADASADRAAFEESVRRLLSALEETLGAAGKVVRDPVVRKDLTALAASLRKALMATFESAGEQVRERIPAQVRRVRGSGDGKSAHATTKATAHKAAPRKAAAVAHKPAARTRKTAST